MRNSSGEALEARQKASEREAEEEPSAAAEEGARPSAPAQTAETAEDVGQAAWCVRHEGRSWLGQSSRSVSAIFSVG